MKPMKIRAVLALCLCAVMIFAACRKNEPEEPPASGPVEPISLSGYGLIRPQNTSDSVTASASDLYEALLEAVGGDPDFSTDYLEAGAQPDASTKEILVGHTNRSETAQVLGELQPGE